MWLEHFIHLGTLKQPQFICSNSSHECLYFYRFHSALCTKGHPGIPLSSCIARERATRTSETEKSIRRYIEAFALNCNAEAFITPGDYWQIIGAFASWWLYIGIMHVIELLVPAQSGHYYRFTCKYIMDDFTVINSNRWLLKG